MKRILLFLSILLSTSAYSQNPNIITQPFIGGLTSPLAMGHCNDSRIFIVQKNGIIKIADAITGVVNPIPFLDIDARVGSGGSEQGLLGIAFHPDYKNNGYFFLNYTDNSGNTNISRFSVNPADSNLALPNSEIVLHLIAQPFSNHNGGNLAFGPDGYLYIGMGDGGSGGDPQNNGQNPNALLAKMLRIDVSHGDSSLVPATNPFINTPGYKPQIWQTGLRNPWRYSFDRLTGDLWIGDVGQNAIEEIDLQPTSSTGGENWGWRCYEGNSPYNPAGCQPLSAYNAPVYEFSHSGGNCSVSGGYVYRGARYGNFNGHYIFTDYCSPLLRTLKVTATDTMYLAHSNAPNSAVGFGEDMYGELYVFNMSGGSIARIVDTSSCNPVAEISVKDTIQLCDTAGFISTHYYPGMVYSWFKDGAQLPYSDPKIRVDSSGTYVVLVYNPQTICYSTDTVYVSIGNPAVHIVWTGDIYSDTAFCANAIPFLLLNASPAGGTFYGPFISNDTLNTTAFIQSGTPGDKLIEYRYTDTLGCTYNDVLKVYYGICFGLNEKSGNSFVIYPNPATTEASVLLNKPVSDNSNWYLFDSSGRRILSGKCETGVTRFNISLSGLDAGAYTLSIHEKDGVTTSTLMVIK